MGLLFAVVLLGAAGLYINAQQDGKGESVDPRFANIDISGKVIAPEFKGEVGWLNVEKPLRIRDLRGKVVIPFSVKGALSHLQAVPNQDMVGSMLKNAVAGKALEAITGKAGSPFADLLKEFPGQPKVTQAELPSSQIA